MTGADLFFGPLDKTDVAKTVLVGRKTNLLSSAAIQALPSGCPADLWTALVESAGDAGDDGKSVSTLYIPVRARPRAPSPEKHNTRQAPTPTTGLQ